MKSLILLEVEHGEDTDDMAIAMAYAIASVNNGPQEVKVTDYGVRIDLPRCFVLDVDVPGTVELYVRAAASLPTKE